MEASGTDIPIMQFSSINREGTCGQQEDLARKVQSSSTRILTRSITIPMKNHPLVKPEEVDTHSSNDIRTLKRSRESIDSLYTVKTCNQKRRALNHDVQYPMILEEHHNDTKNKLDTCYVLKTSNCHVPNPLLSSHYIPCDQEEKVNSCFIPSNNRFVSQSSITSSQNHSVEKQSFSGSMSCRNVGVENSQFDKTVYDLNQDSDDDSNALWDFDFLDEWDDYIEKTEADSTATSQNL